MYNNSNNSDNNNNSSSSRGSIASPRISFSNDFAESHQFIRQDRNVAVQPPRPPPSSSSDFEFSSLSNHSMMTADELFSQGRILPFKHECSRRRASTSTTTLRDELQVEDDDNYNGDGLFMSSASKPPKSSTRWKGFLGLKRSHVGSKKPAADSDRSHNGSRDRPVEVRGSVDRGSHNSRTTPPQGLFSSDGSSSCKDVEMGI